GDVRLAFVLASEARDPPTEAELAGLVAWVAAGGTLVYAAPPHALSGEPFEKRFDLRVSPRFELVVETREGPLAEEHWLAAHLAVAGGATVEAAPGTEPLTEVTSGDRTAGERRVGAGRIIALADASVADNERLGRADNALFFALLARRYGA